MKRSLDEWSKDELVAELRSTEQTPAAEVPESAESLTLHELRVHQIELEMQNRELREAQQLLEESRSRYADLYDLAPIGYCTLDRFGIVRDANLEAARLLGTERAFLTGRPFTAVVTTDLGQLHAHLDECFRTGARATCQLSFERSSGGTITVQLVSTPIASLAKEPSTCMTTLTDVSGLKSSEERLSLLALVSERLASSLDYRATLPSVASLAVPLLGHVVIIDVLAASGQVSAIPSVVGAISPATRPTRSRTCCAATRRSSSRPRRRRWCAPRSARRCATRRPSATTPLAR